MSDFDKVDCPRCGEKISPAAYVCIHCKTEFTEEQVKARVAEASRQRAKLAWIWWTALGFVFILMVFAQLAAS